MIPTNIDQYIDRYVEETNELNKKINDLHNQLEETEEELIMYKEAFDRSIKFINDNCILFMPIDELKEKLLAGEI